MRERGDFCVRSDVREGKSMGMGFKEERVARWVKDRSRVRRVEKVRADCEVVDERVDIGLERRERYLSEGRAERGVIESRVVILLKERSRWRS